MYTAAMVYQDLTFDQFDVLHMMKSAYINAFTAPNIISGFKKTGIFPADATKLSPSSSLKLFNDTTKCLNLRILRRGSKVEWKNTQKDQLQPVVVSKGQISTEKGILVTSENASKAFCQQHEFYVQRAREKSVAASERELKLEKEKSAKKGQRRV